MSDEQQGLPPLLPPGRRVVKIDGAYTSFGEDTLIEGRISWLTQGDQCYIVVGDCTPVEGATTPKREVLGVTFMFPAEGLRAMISP